MHTIVIYTVSYKLFISLTIDSGDGLSTYRDETGIFFRDPETLFSAGFPEYIDTAFLPSVLAPHEYALLSHLVLFNALLRERGVEDALCAKGYADARRAGNGIGRIFRGERESEFGAGVPQRTK